MELVGAFQEILCAVVQCLCAFAEITAAGMELFASLFQSRSSVFELSGSVQKFCGAFIELSGSLFEFAGAFTQFIRRIIQAVHILFEFIELSVFSDGEIAEQIARCHGHRHIEFKVGGISFDFEVFRDVEAYKIVGFVHGKAVFEARECHAYDKCPFPFRDHFSVDGSDVGEFLLIEFKSRHHCEGNSDSAGFAVDRLLFAGVVGVIKADHDMAAFAGELLGADRFPFQRVGDLHIYRKLFCGRSLVVDISAVGVPGDGSVGVFRKALIARDIFDIFEEGGIVNRLLSRGVFQPVTDDHRIALSAGIGDDIDSLLFSIGVLMFFRWFGCIVCIAFLCPDIVQAERCCSQTRKHRFPGFSEYGFHMFPNASLLGLCFR